MSKVIIVDDDGKMSNEDRDYLRRCFKKEIDGHEPCKWCGGLHQRECRRVKKMTYNPSGERVAEVEFWPDGGWDDSAVVWPEDVFRE